MMAMPSLFEKQTQRAQLHAAIAASAIGLTDEEAQSKLGMEGSTQRPRRGELVKAGLVKDSGVKRMTKAHKWAIVWVVA